MDIERALSKLEELRELMDQYRTKPEQFTQENWDHITEVYAQVEEVIHAFDGTQRIAVDTQGLEKAIHKDFVSAGWLSGRTTYMNEGRTQLLKVIAKLRARLEDPGVISAPASIDQLSRALRRFRECCQYIETLLENERHVQDIVWIMLRSQFDRVEREETLPKFGVKGYRPDFGIPDLRTLVEVKFIGSKTSVAEIQEEILADVPGYLADARAYGGLLVFVYDSGHKLLDPRKFVEDLRQVEGILDVIVIPGITRRPAS